jgi:hypothetical protein
MTVKVLEQPERRPVQALTAPKEPVRPQVPKVEPALREKTAPMEQREPLPQPGRKELKGWPPRREPRARKEQTAHWAPRAHLVPTEHWAQPVRD